ncbi:MAG TPA: hypothetical protein VEC38_14490 [Candidatus Binataceae bacterium]|nr:hypothetical protein [Candidatus Binataceae bacterium]
MLAGLAVSAQGCWFWQQNQPAAAPVPQAEPTARVVTDLSALSAQPAVPLSRAESALKPPEGLESEATSRPTLVFGDVPGSERRVGTGMNPAVERLMNEKAAEFASFSYDLMDHVWPAIRRSEETEEIARLKLPSELRAVIITATFDRNGGLTELVLEQHSGKAAIDRMFLDSSRKSLWSASPPPGALTPSGVYQARVEYRIENYTSMDGIHWNFKTFMGVGLL